MSTHDVRAFASGLSARLATRSRHVNLFLGAGTSKAAGLPDVAELQGLIKTGLGDSQGAAFARLLGKGNVETALTKIRRMVALLGSGDQIEGLDAEQAAELDKEVCRQIVTHLGKTDGLDLKPARSLAGWLARTNYLRPVEVFTVNYDLLIEQALDALGAPYFDGFGGLLSGRFRSDLVDAESTDDFYIPSFFSRVWKLHGSLNWAMVSGSVVRLGTPVLSGQTAAIYPSDSKYDESRRVPFVVLQDRFRRALNEPESLTLVSGYSWGDPHLNEQIYDASSRRPRSEVIAFCFSDIPEQLADRAAITPNLQVVSPREAILGTIRAPWVAPEGDAPPFIWDGNDFQLGNFASLAAFLARASHREPEPSTS